ncbi:MAG: hypothetical protein A3K19_25725 [Lentisphaerae bacterium RIFOXYB12_FULL_65_16]|nr:MAG: hypothetical protein A3K18_03180 [Lentisphaerae bacterium RIFOXYA12_64_32]OGV89549.1 MAG: hypothetical protein A3K19_25725 [Lentisphaerae bacterium RIFOXYB12_FULL_65_16]
MRKVTYHATVGDEVIRSAVYYEQQCEGLGSRFLDDYDRALTDITCRPSAWPPLDGPYRRHQLRHFPYGVIYRVLPDQIRILALMHLHQHPDYWKGRR